MREYNGFTGEQRLQGDRIIKQAIKDGILPPLHEVKCSICGQDKGVRHYHNEDYTPGNVVSDAIPICFRCHMHIHARNKKTENWIKYEKEVFKGNKKSIPVYTKYWTKEWEDEVCNRKTNNLDQYLK